MSSSLHGTARQRPARSFNVLRRPALSASEYEEAGLQTGSVGTGELEHAFIHVGAGLALLRRKI